MTRIRAQRTLTALVFAAALAACSTVSGGFDRPEADNARAAMQIKAALMNDGQADAAPIRVTIRGEAVLLEGFVESQAAADKAIGIARRNADGRRVTSKLVVR